MIVSALAIIHKTQNNDQPSRDEDDQLRRTPAGCDTSALVEVAEVRRCRSVGHSRDVELDRSQSDA
jgi:hypothetical protein